MLNELHVENFAIIDRLELEFDSGLNIFTGETGAGKSIIIDAVEAILGSRADVNMIRTGADRAHIEATFEISPEVRAPINEILESEELLDEQEILILSREIRANGRSVARVNGRTVRVGLLSELGEFLVDVHGQSEHLSLLRVRQHLGLLDIYANTSDSLNAYRKTYYRLNQVRNELEELRQAESEAARRMDILKYQINEIESSQLRPGEEENLKEERNRLANAEGLASIVQEAIQLLDEGSPESPAATDLIGQTVSGMNNLVRLDPTQSILGDQSQQLFENLTDLVLSLRGYLEGVESNPKRLDQIEARLSLIQNLKLKYGDDIPTILVFAEEARRQLDTITHAGERIEVLEIEEKDLLSRLSEEGQTLSKERHHEAEKLECTLESELENLSMSGARFKVDFQLRDDPNGVLISDDRRVVFDVNGIERIEFLVAPNPGEGLKPLVKIASGGETSRLMLGIKNVLARADQVPTLIFDEIDQGIGGRVGTIVGYKLWELAKNHQVLCVTHLPQLAAYGERHYRVLKHIEAGRTVTQVDTLVDNERLEELAHMMGDISEGTRRSAKELLHTVDQTKKDTIV
jgi:DNA repair protein RecN (Recombination protein N)